MQTAGVLYNQQLLCCYVLQVAETEAQRYCFPNYYPFHRELWAPTFGLDGELVKSSSSSNSRSANWWAKETSPSESTGNMSALSTSRAQRRKYHKSFQIKDPNAKARPYGSFSVENAASHLNSHNSPPSRRALTNCRELVLCSLEILTYHAHNTNPLLTYSGALTKFSTGKVKWMLSLESNTS